MDVEDKLPRMGSRRVSEPIPDSIFTHTKNLFKKTVRVTTKENILRNEYMYCYLGI